MYSNEEFEAYHIESLYNSLFRNWISFQPLCTQQSKEFSIRKKGYAIEALKLKKEKKIPTLDLNLKFYYYFDFGMRLKTYWYLNY